MLRPWILVPLPKRMVQSVRRRHWPNTNTKGEPQPYSLPFDPEPKSYTVSYSAETQPHSSTYYF